MRISKHFDISRWVEFVRGTGERESWAVMEQHLESGCKRCGATVRVLRTFAAHAPIEASYEPPSAIVRRAEAIFPLQRPEKVTFAQLVYDSFREPLPAGMRAQDRSARHALYEAGQYCLDLRLEHEPSSGVITVVGQIADREQPGANTTLPVLLMADKKVVASAMCNGLGEFEIEFTPARDLRLHVPVRDSGAHLTVRMDEVAPVPLRPGVSRKASSRPRPARKPSQP
jgi:hypothetical protein